MSRRRMNADDVRDLARTPEQRAAIERQLAGAPTYDYSRDRDMKPHKVTHPRRRKGEMTKLEQRYAAWLDQLKEAERVLAWVYEPFALELAPRTTYTPDFLVFRPRVADDGVEAEFVEVKPRKKNGRPLWLEDSRVKWKVAAEQHAACGAFRVAWPGAPGTEGWLYEDAPRP